MEISYKKECKVVKFLSKKDKTAYKWAIQTFFYGNHNTGVEPVMFLNLMEAGITNFDFAEYEDKVVITITLIRPGLLIGKAGSVLKN